MFALQDSELAVSIDRTALTLINLKSQSQIRLAITRTVESIEKDNNTLLVIMEGELRAALSIDRDHALVMQLYAPESCTESVQHPFIYYPEASERILLTIDEGICIRADEPSEFLCVPRPCCGRECTMPFSAVLLQENYLLMVLDTEWDAQMQLVRGDNGNLYDTFHWLPRLGKWGYSRQIRYYFAPGQVTQVCKQFRAYRQSQGILVTLEQKCKQNPKVKKLLGTANVWLWHDAYEQLMYANSQQDVDIDNSASIRKISDQMQALGMDRILWGVFFGADSKCVPALKEQKGYLCAQYDCLTDVPPDDVLDVVPQNRIENCGYSTRRIKDYPDGIAYDASMQPRPAWALPGLDGKMHPQNKLCPSRMPLRLREELMDCYQSDSCDVRFIDVMGVETYECFHPQHVVSRQESVSLRQESFDFVTKQGFLVGTEDGFDRLVPYLHYNEGMMSPVFFRYQYENAGRMKAFCHGEDAAKFFDSYLLNPSYRVPLWELVYHDCVVSYWYWGDSSCCCPDRMHRKDLLNLLYGTAPMYSFRSRNWGILKDQIVASYHSVVPLAHQVGGQEMVSFSYLNTDETVQQTVFADGTVVQVNFSDAPFETADGVIEANGFITFRRRAE